MSRDIRSYFMGGGKTSKPSVESAAVKKPVKKIILDSSDEEDSNKISKPTVTKPSRSNEKKKSHSSRSSTSKRRIISDDEEELVTKDRNPKKKANLAKLSAPVKKVVDVTHLFGTSTIARIPKKKDEKIEEKSNDISILLNSDEDFELSMVECEMETHKKTNDEPTITGESEHNTKPIEIVTPPKKSAIKLEEIILKSDLVKPHTSSTPSSLHTESKKHPRTNSATLKFNESTAQDDQDRHEKKRLAAILYQKFKNRSSVINPGCKELPKGQPNCLAGQTFVITGILESLERDEVEKLIHDYGGKVAKAISKKTSYIVVGEEAGPAKIGKAEDMGIRQLTEDGLFEIINNSNKSSKGEPSPKKIKIEPPKIPLVIKELNFKKESSKGEGDDEIPSHTVVKKQVEVKPAKSENTPKPIKKEIERSVPTIPSICHNKDISDLPWVEKYKPTSCDQIIGQQGPKSNVNLLKNWLQKWHSNQDGTKKLQKPNPWKKNDDGSYFKAALLSGPPGIGKTTTVNLVCKELGYDVVEFNASDTRSKKLLQQEVSELLNNQSLYGYCHGDEKASSKNHVLVMDEVDGMAGNEDRGGIQELISLIKDTSTPIICMCNDRNHQKMRSLVNYCFDLRFHKPRVEQIKAPIMSILYKEKFKVPTNTLLEIISSTNNDIRQTLNYLSLLSSKKDLEEMKPNAESTKKDLKLGPWDVVRKVFSAEEHKKMSIYDKSDLFFHDYSIGPLFVQQNYLSVTPKCPKSEVLSRVTQTADILSMGDMVDRRIRSNNAWSLLPVQAMFSSVLPGEYMAGNFTGQINFPGWLGKNSKTTKRKRLAQEVHDHTRTKTSASVLSFQLDYAPILLKAITGPLVSKGLEGVPKAIEIIKEYRLLREDIDSLIELTAWPGQKSPFDAVDSKVKAALTRTYNKEICPYSYSVTAAIKKKKLDQIDDNLEFEGNEETYQDSDEDKADEDLNNDALIKMKKVAVPSKKGAGAEASSSKAGTSKTAVPKKISKKK